MNFKPGWNRGLTKDIGKARRRHWLIVYPSRGEGDSDEILCDCATEKEAKIRCAEYDDSNIIIRHKETK